MDTRYARDKESLKHSVVLLLLLIHYAT